jgi:acetyltransferase
MASTPLDALFRPRVIAVVGASERPGAIGASLLGNLTGAGFTGRILPVSPNHRLLGGQACYPSVAQLPETPDLGVVCTPPPTVPEVVDALGARGARAAVVITAGFGERADGGPELQRAVQAAAAQYGLRLVGPNCLGIIVPGCGLNASFAQRMPAPGRLAFVAQSGAIVTAVIDWAAPRGIGFSQLVSLGDMADVGFGDVLDYLSGDPATRGILLYIESVRDARRFLSAARAAARMKPVIVVKGGRHPEGARAVAAHTGVLAGSDAVYDAAFRRAGVLRVHGLTELFDAAEILALGKPPPGDRLLILSNGGGLAVLATDELMEQGGRLAELPKTAVAALDAVLPAAWSRANPVDINGDADAERYAGALAVLCKLPEVDGLLVLYCPTAVVSPGDTAAAVVAAPRGPQLLTSWVGEAAVAGARGTFAEHRIPTYDTPEQAVRAFMYLVRYRESQRLLMETPPSPPEDFRTDPAAVRALLERTDADALAQRGGWLTDVDARVVLAAYGIPTAPGRLGDAAPAVELRVGVAEDAQFGPVLGVGLGGRCVDAVDGQALGLPPLNLRLARELIARTRIHGVLAGAGGEPAGDVDGLALVLMQVSQLVCDFAEIQELEIDPLCAGAEGIIALDVHIRVDPRARADDPGERLAIRPYPKALEETIHLGDGRRLLLRPIRPEDEPALQEAVAGLTSEEARLRFFAPTRTLSHVAAARFTQLDYDREMALVLTEPGMPGRTPIYAVANLSATPDLDSAEYAVLVRHDWAGMGLGVLLMRRIIDYARSRGIGELVGDVLRDNRTMLKLCQVFGFTSHRDPDDLGIVKVRLRLDA